MWVQGCWTSGKQGSLSQTQHWEQRCGLWSCCVHMPPTRETGIWEPTVSKLCCWGVSAIHINIYTHKHIHMYICDLLLKQGREQDMAVCCAPVSVCLPDRCQTCLHVNVMCARAPWACTYKQYIFSLITGHIWGRGAATASRCWIQQVIFP